MSQDVFSLLFLHIQVSYLNLHNFKFYLLCEYKDSVLFRSYKFHNNFAFIILEIAIHQWRKWTKTPQAYLMYLMQKLYLRVLSFESGKTHFSRFFHVFDSPNGEKRSSWGADFGVIGKPIAIFLIAVYCSHFDISVSTKHSEKTRF